MKEVFILVSSESKPDISLPQIACNIIGSSTEYAAANTWLKKLYKTKRHIEYTIYEMIKTIIPNTFYNNAVEV